MAIGIAISVAGFIAFLVVGDRLPKLTTETVNGFDVNAVVGAVIAVVVGLLMLPWRGLQKRAAGVVVAGLVMVPGTYPLAVAFFVVACTLNNGCS